MPSVNLSAEQVQKIQQDVHESGISFSHLEADLVDHICCYVEELMEYGQSFEQAYKKARKRINIEQLKDIEIKTILLITQKFKTMKTFMKITGITGIGLLIISLIFKSGHIAGANVLFLLGIVSIAFAYIPALLLTVRREKLIKRNMHIFYSGLITVFLILVSYIFTMMHWPYRSYVLLFTWISAFVFILLLFLGALKNEENRIINLSVVLILTVVISLSIFSYSIMARNPQNEIRVLEYNIEESNAFFDNSLSDLQNKLHERINDELLTGEYSGLIDESNSIISKLSLFKEQLFSDKTDIRKYNKRFLKPYVLDESLQEFAQQLEQNMQSYQSFVLNILDRYGLKELDQYVRKSLVFSQLDFNQNSVVVYNNISRLQRDIKIIEREILSEMLNRAEAE